MMNGFKITTCFFCGNQALSYDFVDEAIPNEAIRLGGIKYDYCKGGCPPYAIPGDIFLWFQAMKSSGVLDKSLMDRMISTLKKHTEAHEYEASAFFKIDENIVREAWGLGIKREKG